MKSKQYTEFVKGCMGFLFLFHICPRKGVIKFFNDSSKISNAYSVTISSYTASSNPYTSQYEPFIFLVLDEVISDHISDKNGKIIVVYVN